MSVEVNIARSGICEVADRALNAFCEHYPDRFKAWARALKESRELDRDPASKDMGVHSLLPTTVKWLMGNEAHFNQAYFGSAFGTGDRNWWTNAEDYDAVVRHIGAKVTRREGVSRPEGWS